MSFEEISTPKNKEDIPKITTEEWIKFSGGNKGDEEFRKWMKEKGIELNSRDAKVNLDGEVITIKTNEEDFGEIVEDPDHILEGSKA